MSDNKQKISLTFIINGQNFALDVNINAPLVVAVQKALHDTGNSGRSPDEWEVRDANGVFVDTSRTAEDLGLKADARIFVSLKVGAGGSHACRSGS